MIPITRLSVGPEEAKAAAEAVMSGWLTVGKRGEAFEQAIARYVGAEHAITVNSCTTALHLALLAAGVKPGDEVICPSHSFIASANAILYAGGKPRFVDIDLQTYNIDPALIEAAITEKTRAILPVSQIGLGADIPSILEIARRHKLKVVEDAAPSMGALAAGKFIGTLSDLTCFSFDARKILTTGEGGVITTNDAAAAARLRKLRAHAASTSTADRHQSDQVRFEEYPELGYNYKMTDIQAAVGLVQIGRIQEIVEERRRLAQRYNCLLGDLKSVVVPYEPPGWRHVYQSYCVRLTNGKPQLAVMNEMARAGVATRRIMAIHREPFYRAMFPSLSLPVTEKATDTTLLLPLFVGLKESEQDEVVRALKAAVGS
jgi:perosamine synthetase